jgi:hypothetical protein
VIDATAGPLVAQRIAELIQEQGDSVRELDLAGCGAHTGGYPRSCTSNDRVPIGADELVEHT